MKKMAIELKLENSLNDNSSYIVGPISIKLHRHIACVSHSSICWTNTSVTIVSDVFASDAP